MHKGISITFSKNIVRHNLCFVQIEQHQIGPGKGAGCKGLFMLHLPMNNGGDSVFLVLLNGVPHL